MSENNDYACFIRRQGQPWTRGRAHHRLALETFLDEYIAGQEEEELQIVVPHTDGGDFVAWFRRLNSSVSQYRDEYGQTVYIMMSHGAEVGFINRVIDY